MIKKALFVSLVLMLAAATAVTGYGSPALGAPPRPDSTDLDLSDLGKTIEESIRAEKAGVEGFQAQLDLFKQEKLLLAAALNGYQLRVSAYENLLLAAGVDLASIKKAQAELQASMNDIQKMVGDLAPRLKVITAALSNIDQQKTLSKKQASVLGSVRDSTGVARQLQARARELTGILEEKESLLRQLETLVTARLEYLERLLTSFSELSGKFETSVKQLRKQSLFERHQNLYSAATLSALKDEGREFARQAGDFVTPVFWHETMTKLWQNNGGMLVVLVFLGLAATVLLYRTSRGESLIAPDALVQQLGPWHQLVIQVINRSYRLAAFTLLVYLCAQLDAFYFVSRGLQLAAYLLIATLVTRWAKIALAHWPWKQVLPAAATARLTRLAALVRYYCWLHLLADWLLGSAAITLLLLRLGFEAALIGWAFIFWRSDALKPPEPVDFSPQRLTLTITAKTACYLIVAVPVVMDLFGYGTLALFWLLSWGRSILVCFGWAATFFQLREWDLYYRGKRSALKDEHQHDEYPVQWLMIRVGQLAGTLALMILLVLAWGGHQAILLKIYGWLGYQLQLGSMSFSFLGLFYSILVLLATQAVARLWRWVFQTKFLSRSGMDVGLQDSITTITVYAIWVFGFIIAMHVFGLNTATMAVAVGALGVGLGFGLQNIFNNFISGIILLFERPIQVGDDVEINGTWATVKKINVRSTVVQSYDNASLIIPNSEFISSQVTNWSFKDKRLRRNVVVGVAYGSDVELVRDTLLEIAHTTKRVLKRPEPDVLFTDFGDSALTFKLRFWTVVDNMLRTETAIRFEIDRLFKERGIEIAFPQRDIHIRSTVAGNPFSEQKVERKIEDIAEKDT